MTRPRVPSSAARGTRPGCIAPIRPRAAAARRVLRTVGLAACGLAQAIDAQPANEDLQARLAEARQLIQAGSANEAIELLKTAVRERPDDAGALLLLGSALSLVPRRSEAVQSVLRAMELRPESGQVHASAGSTLARLGEQDAALQVFERAVSLDPELGEAHASIAMLLASREQFQRAAAHLDRALGLETEAAKLGRLHYLRGKLSLELGEVERARGEFQRSAALDPGSAAARLALGLAEKRLLREDRAYPMFRKAVELDPGSAEARYHLALELQRRGEPEEAAAHLSKAQQIEPGDRSIVYNLVRALHQAGRSDEAREYREKLAGMVSSGDQARQNELDTARLHGEAVRLDQAGNYAEALEKYRAVLRVEPLHVVARRNFALALCRLGRWSEGIEELQSILRDNPGDADTSRALAIAADEARQAGLAPQPSPESGTSRR